MEAVVHAVDLQGRDGGVLMTGALFGLYPFLLKLYANAGYQGAKFQDGLRDVCGSVMSRSFGAVTCTSSSRCPNDGSTLRQSRSRDTAHHYECL